MSISSVSTTLSSAIYSAIVANEVGGNLALASTMLPPLASGQSGWTLGTIQLDFNTASVEAQQALTSALVAAGYCSQSTATSIGQAFTTAGRSSSVSFTGLKADDGSDVSLSAINTALATFSGSNSVVASSQAIFSQNLNSLVGMLNSESLSPAVISALNDPAQGPLLLAVLADYNNQYSIGAQPNNGTMLQLLTMGATQLPNGPTITLDTTREGLNKSTKS